MWCRRTSTRCMARWRTGPLAIALPKFVRKELEGYLACGLLCHGFARLKCGGCDETRLVAFSCKGRGFCPSCLGRKMSATAAHLIEDVLPPVDLRQWVLTVPNAREKAARLRRPAGLGAHAHLRQDGAWVLPRTGWWTFTRTERCSGRGSANLFRSEAEPARARGVPRRRISGHGRRARLPSRWAPVDARRGGGAREYARPDGEIPTSSRTYRGRRLGG